MNAFPVDDDFQYICIITSACKFISSSLNLQQGKNIYLVLFGIDYEELINALKGIIFFIFCLQQYFTSVKSWIPCETGFSIRKANIELLG